MQLPQWLYDKIGGDGNWYTIDSTHRGFSPNYANSTLIEAHRQLITALGQRCDIDPIIAFIQLGSLGHFGEWHIINSAGSMPSPSITARYVDHYKKAFPSKVLMFRRPVSQMKAMDAGLYNDMIGDSAATNRWLEWISNGRDTEFLDMIAIPDFWVHRTFGRRISRNGDPNRYLGDDSIVETMRQIAVSHTSMIGPSAPIDFSDPAIKANAQRLLDTMGYRFQIQTVTIQQTAVPGTTITLRQSWKNSGNCPMYYPWPVHIQLRQVTSQDRLTDQNINESAMQLADTILATYPVDTDVRNWLPGIFELKIEIKLPADLTPGTYAFTTAIIDPVTNLPGIALANYGRLTDGTYLTGQIEIHQNN